MNIITKYLGKTITTYVAMVILFLLGLQIFIEFMQEFRHIGTGNYGLQQMFVCVLLLLPYDIYQFFPMAGLLGCVLGMGLLASHSELIAMRAAGLSLFGIVKAIAKAAICLVIIMFLIGEGVAPMAQKSAMRKKAMAMSDGQALVTTKGIWVRSKNSFLHIDAIASNKELQGITRYELDENKKIKTISHAQKGSHKGGVWVFSNIVQTIFTDNNKITSAETSEQVWSLTLSHKLIETVNIHPDQESIAKLYSYIKHRKQVGLSTSDYEFIFWQRVLAPISALIMILLAIPFVFGPLRSTTMGLRMLAGIILGFVFHIFNQFVGPMSVVYQIPPVLAAMLPMLLFGVIGMVLLTRSR